MKVEYIVLHHSETPGGDKRLIHKIHVIDNKWRDIGYHKIICNGKAHGNWEAGEDGEVQNGRPLDEDVTLELNEMGAHCLGYNQKSVGICLIGNFQYNKPTYNQIVSLTSLLISLCNQFSLDPLNAIVGHRDLCNTLCPGLLFYDMLVVLKQFVKSEQIVFDKFLRYFQ